VLVSILTSGLNDMSAERFHLSNTFSWHVRASTAPSRSSLDLIAGSFRSVLRFLTRRVRNISRSYGFRQVDRRQGKLTGYGCTFWFLRRKSLSARAPLLLDSGSRLLPACVRPRQ